MNCAKAKSFIFGALLAIIFASCENPMFIQSAGLFKVEFDANGGSPVEAVRTGRISGEPQTSKENCDFAGWYESSDFKTERLVFPFDVQKDTTLYAKWLQKYAVKFDTGGVAEIAAVMTSEIFEAPKMPARDGFALVGWYLDGNFAKEAEFPFFPNGDTTLYAKWLRTYAVTFQTNGGSAVAQMQTARIEEAPETTLSGSTFAGWYLDAAFSDSKRVEFPYAVSRDTTLYAKWLKNHTVKFEANGGSAVAEMQTARIEDAPKTTLGGKTFAGWYLDADCSAEKRVAFPFSPDGDTTLYAKWTALVWTVKYDKNGAESGSVPPSVSVESGKSITVSANTGKLAKTGFLFKNWSASADGAGGQTYAQGDTFLPSEDTTLYAQWEKDYTAMIGVEGGTFKMGDPNVGSRPTITLNAFRIAQYELTYELWQEVYDWARDNGYSLSSAKKGHSSNDGFKSIVPATNFSWNMACVWLNAYSEYKGLDPVYFRGNTVWRDDSSYSGTVVWDKARNGFRLPTECEWEYAAGGGKAAARTAYSGSDKIDDVAWFGGNSGNEAHPVGTKKQNLLGLYDISGSVNEWCYDYYVADYGTGNLANPVHESGSDKVYRGGSILDPDKFCKIFSRQYQPYNGANSRLSLAGIRVAQNAAQ